MVRWIPEERIGRTLNRNDMVNIFRDPTTPARTPRIESEEPFPVSLPFLPVPAPMRVVPKVIGIDSPRLTDQRIVGLSSPGHSLNPKEPEENPREKREAPREKKPRTARPRGRGRPALHHATRGPPPHCIPQGNAITPAGSICEPERFPLMPLRILIGENASQSPLDLFRIISVLSRFPNVQFESHSS